MKVSNFAPEKVRGGCVQAVGRETPGSRAVQSGSSVHRAACSSTGEKKEMKKNFEKIEKENKGCVYALSGVGEEWATLLYKCEGKEKRRPSGGTENALPCGGRKGGLTTPLMAQESLKGRGKIDVVGTEQKDMRDETSAQTL